LQSCDGSLVKELVRNQIIDGNEAKSHSRPYMVFLEVKNGSKISFCGGFLILPNFILTAAHCNGPTITALLGAHDQSKLEKSQQVISVMDRYPHENYNPSGHLNDIMLLKVSIIIKQNVTCSVAGWGDTVTNGTGSKVLREVDVKIKQNCPSPLQIYLQSLNLAILFQGDSGGPLVCPDDMNINTVVGIVSHRDTTTCEEPTGKNVYTRVFEFRHWIETKIITSSSA
uniref:trypsin n=1 Tax=Erpetoichthys calabaricus TaxID=27687 RepID=A0A8C4THP5_ERPCA